MKSSAAKKQDEILAFIYSFTKENGYPPSVREIGKAVGLNSTSTVHNYLEKLKESGKINRGASKTRALSPVHKENNSSSDAGKSFVDGKEVFQMPVIGNVAAGQPILADENIVEYYPISSEFIPPKSNSFMLKVRGDSMMNAGILNGDYIMVKQTSQANNGDIVVALIEDEATVKTFYQENGYIRLQPENPSFEPIICKEDVSIVGTICGLMRKYF